MSPKGISQTIQMADGTVITIETGKLAKQAHGAVVITIGKTMLLATVVSSKEAREDVDFLPLSVDYKEKYAATGKFPGGFFKREGRPSDYEVLISRLVDRALRPLFPDDYHAETQVLINLISGENDVAPDAFAALAASAALSVSDIPFNGPMHNRKGSIRTKAMMRNCAKPFMISLINLAMTLHCKAILTNTRDLMLLLLFWKSL